MGCLPVGFVCHHRVGQCFVLLICYQCAYLSVSLGNPGAACLHYSGQQNRGNWTNGQRNHPELCSTCNIRVSYSIKLFFVRVLLWFDWPFKSLFMCVGNRYFLRLQTWILQVEIILNACGMVRRLRYLSCWNSLICPCFYRHSLDSKQYWEFIHCCNFIGSLLASSWNLEDIVRYSVFLLTSLKLLLRDGVSIAEYRINCISPENRRRGQVLSACAMWLLRPFPTKFCYEFFFII